jgi:hypothetical protein
MAIASRIAVEHVIHVPEATFIPLNIPDSCYQKNDVRKAASYVCR